jgi:hypothetical protein
MKIIPFVIAIVFCFSCHQKQDTPKPENSNIKKESRFKNLLSKYREKSFDTLHVYSPEEMKGEYKGVELDSADLILFPPEIPRQNDIDPPGVFAVYKFQIDTNTIGLITRTPSEYESSSIKLFFFDKSRDYITSYIELAESWGDAGDVAIKDAWVFKNHQKQFQSFIQVREMHYNSAEDEKDTTVEKWNNYYLLNLAKQGDTLSKDSSVLSSRFKHLAERSIQ